MLSKKHKYYRSWLNLKDELEHHRVKKFYAHTNKNDVVRQMTWLEHREDALRLRRIQQKKGAVGSKGMPVEDPNFKLEEVLGQPQIVSGSIRVIQVRRKKQESQWRWWWSPILPLQNLKHYHILHLCYTIISLVREIFRQTLQAFWLLFKVIQQYRYVSKYL